MKKLKTVERTYRIHVAAEMSGISEALIRAWERRYGVIKPRRTASGYRAYTERDIEVLKQLKKLTSEGVSIAEAVTLLPQIEQRVQQTMVEAPVLRRAPQAEQFDTWRRDIIAATERLDQARVEQILDEAAASLPPVVFFEEVVAPVQREVGERWHFGTMTIAEEHLVTQAMRQRLLSLLHAAPRRARKHVVCACLPGEEHDVGLLGAALRFRHAGWRVTFLGARTPFEHLHRVVNAIKPDAVALSAVADLGRPELRHQLKTAKSQLPQGTPLIFGGAAANEHPELFAELGLVAARTPAQWLKLLG